MNIEKYISPEAIETMRQAIAEAGGNEVFFVGYTEEDLIVHKVDAVARGNESAVPAILKIAREADVVIHNHPSGMLKPSSPDLNIASGLDSFSVAFYIVNNDVDDVYVVVEPFAKRDKVLLDLQEMEALLQKEGPIARHINGFEERQQQIDMLSSICAGYNEKKIALIEAGTGTGKTMAYLVPAIYWAVRNKTRVVVSTNTINLQEQLINKDIPLLQKALDPEFEAVLVKGRSNYVCLRKADDVESDFAALAEEHEIEELQELIHWARQSQDGSKADLSVIPSATVWEKIAAESDTCTHSRCKYFRECFVNKARRKAARAHILVVNHHLLFADLAVRRQTGSFADAAILPPYQAIVFDEAHHLEHVATHYFGSRVTRAGLVRILNRLHRRKKAIYKGHLHTLKHRLLSKKAAVPDDIVQRIIMTIDGELVDLIEQIAAMNDELMDSLYQVLQTREQKTGVLDEKEIKLRLLPHIVDQVIYDTGLDAHFKEFIQQLKILSSVLLRLTETVKRGVRSDGEEMLNNLIEVEANAERIEAAADILTEVLFNSSEEDIRWIEAKPAYRNRSILHFQVSPLHIDQVMKEAVFDTFETIIMTSATLTSDNKFDFIRERLGLTLVEEKRNICAQLPAPFNYKEQVIMAVPKDMPDPRSQNFASELSKSVLDALLVSEGRAFVLFTSFGLLNMIFRQLEGPLAEHGIRVLKQGSMNRHDLLNQFKREKTSVLFGTDSFWEGVDVEGDALESVIITKLPFQVPSEPIIEARYEAIEKDGGNPFMEYAVPLAVLKFKQGFGRLIRRKTDRGCVIIFDNRVINKSYGKRFLRSLPECKNVFASREQILSELNTFFHQ